MAVKEAHDVLKGAIKLLDTLRWMERAVKLIMQAGDELDARIREMKHQAAGSDGAEAEEEDEEDEIVMHWHEMRQYLDCIWRLCTSLETDRRMSELRCRAQIDIVSLLFHAQWFFPARLTALGHRSTPKWRRRIIISTRVWLSLRRGTARL